MMFSHIEAPILSPLMSVKENGLKLENIDLSGLADEKRLEVYVAAVNQNALALQWVDKKYLDSVVNEVTVGNILAQNYYARIYLPSHFDDDIKKYLYQVEHVIVTNMPLREIRDIQLVYANNRPHKTLHFNLDLMAPGEEQTVLKRLNMLFSQLNPDLKINFVLLSHSGPNSEVIATIDMKTVTDILAANTNIDRVTLLGCKTVQSQKLDIEKSKAVFSEEQKNANKVGFVITRVDSIKNKKLMQESPIGEVIPTYSQDFYSKLYKAAGSQLLKVYALIQHDDKYFLLHLTKDNKNIHVLGTKEVSGQDVNRIKKVLNGGIKAEVDIFPVNLVQINQPKLKDGELEFDERREIEAVFKQRQPKRFDRDDEHFQEDKKVFYFLQNAKVTINEAKKKLKKSLMKTLLELVEADNRILRSITIKGYTGFLHVDTKEMRLHVVDLHMYTEEYTSSIVCFFHFRKDNIHRGSLEVDRRKKMKQILPSPSSNNKKQKDKEVILDDTLCKSFTVEIEKKTSSQI